MAGFAQDAALDAVFSDSLVRIADCDPCRRALKGAIETVMSEIDIFTSSTGKGSMTLDHMKELKNNAFVGDTARWCADTAI